MRGEERRKCAETDGRYFVKAGNVLQYEKLRKNGVVTVRMTRHEERSNTVLRSRQRLLHLFDRNDTLIIQFIYLIQNIDDVGMIRCISSPLITLISIDQLRSQLPCKWV